ncbi:phosphoenolpyruvate carboxykinase (ATP) [Pseudarcicella hirudinis]|uniref:Phosphoenolpyruvate carboxykinase (ATP) n=1 Tax=Pseudarcicella hirudinis TaxID=1079859 RepID=A0A1I5XZ48_9BACT|nr:phosphoenolpyruvate carboxykinase (ATP) [Pseudarcicella hirudinis]SFQ37218.1 phosphoenolpyruvate carboxykinase (ATP) [Pseudarcicella hirudinis]
MKNVLTSAELNPAVHPKHPALAGHPDVLLNPDVTTLTKEALQNNEGVLTDTGALMCDTGTFTGRSPKDKFVVSDELTRQTICWGDINQPFDSVSFGKLYRKMLDFVADKKIYARYAYACASPKHRINILAINTMAWHNLFCHHLFLRPAEEELTDFEPEWVILNVPEFEANPLVDGTRAGNFTIIDFSRKVILIGGTAYAGEMKKGIFTVLNYLLPQEKGILSMHCSANIGQKGDTALFFGLSGTGKTTLSADPERKLIGDDEHGWSDDEIFNFEGGCYAKVINLSKENEPEIFQAIRSGSILENTRFHEGTAIPDFANQSVTENTRSAYPISFIQNSVSPSLGKTPENIFFLTADAFGVLPPVSRLNTEQAMYYFISGYTSKLAGTEVGIKEPQATFSACFGAAFLPLHPFKYAELLGEKIRNNEVNVWLINTGWNGGPYGVGSRMKLPYTRAMIHAALEGHFDQVAFTTHPIFGLEIPETCPNVPSELLNPENTWKDKAEYKVKAIALKNAFQENFKKYSGIPGAEQLLNKKQEVYPQLNLV